MRFKITELYNTKYLYRTMNVDLNYLFTTIKALQADNKYAYNVGNTQLGKVYDAAKAGAPIEFDLAETKITPDVVTTLMHYSSQGIVFVDSKDKWRDDIFRTNRERAAIDKSGAVNLPEYDPEMTVKEYIKSLDKNTIYQIPLTQNDVYIPLTIMILLSRPSVNILIDNKAKDLFTYVGSRLTVQDLLQYKKFYFTSPEGTQVLDFTSGKAHVQRLGEVDIITAGTVGTLVPIEFGSTKLLGKQCWDNLLKSCLNILNGYRSSQKVKLGDLLV